MNLFFMFCCSIIVVCELSAFKSMKIYFILLVFSFRLSFLFSIILILTTLSTSFIISSSSRSNILDGHFHRMMDASCLKVRIKLYRCNSSFIKLIYKSVWFYINFSQSNIICASYYVMYFFQRIDYQIQITIRIYPTIYI